MSVRSRLARLERHAEERQPGRPRTEDKEAAEQRRDETLTRFLEVLPDELWDRVKAALGAGRCPLWQWLEDVSRGRSRLPECLTEDVMRRLVLIRLDGAASWSDFLEGVCLRCGLQYPLPNFPSSAQCNCSNCEGPNEDRKRRRAESLALFGRLFDGRGCPACGASWKAGEMNWAHLMEDGYWAADGHGGAESRGAAAAGGGVPGAAGGAAP